MLCRLVATFDNLRLLEQVGDDGVVQIVGGRSDGDRDGDGDMADR